MTFSMHFVGQVLLVFVGLVFVQVFCEQCPTPVCQDEWLASEFPDPVRSSGLCGRYCQQSWICDPCGILSNGSALSIDNIIRHVPADESLCRGATSSYIIAVAIVNKMKFDYGAKEVNAEKFAKSLRQDWDYYIGTGCGNMVVIFLSKEDRQVFCEQCPTPVCQDEWLASEFPDPVRSSGLCGRYCQQSWICDPCGILSNGAKEVNAEKFAKSLRQDWDYYIGTGCGNMVVIFLSKEDRQVYTSAGVVAAEALTSSCIQGVYEDARDKYLKNDMFNTGMIYMATEYKKILEDGGCGLKGWAIALIVIGSLVGLIGTMVLCVCCCRCPGGGGGGGSSSSHWGGGGGWFDGGGGGGGGGGDSGGGGGF